MLKFLRSTVRTKHSIYRVLYYLLLQASIEGLRLCPLQIKEDYCIVATKGLQMEFKLLIS